ncbi:hypothetical protein J2Z49_002956 [Desulfofundulus luciae]|uniref:Uncharacterized protein n=1 Tax=Desulfofundulus luciae TaxID=74702 RepID=A0ABU0B5P6_9FIRM|nr:hypothetical protein [Desulfofundulus luciae]MDQ0287823.1 hypothetical protein [Desulfofundulus luciae]
MQATDTGGAGGSRVHQQGRANFFDLGPVRMSAGQNRYAAGKFFGYLRIMHK